jgi:sulfate transport system permease protein
MSAVVTPAADLGEAAELPTHLRHPAATFAKWLCVGVTMLFLTLMIVLPAINVFRQAFAGGWQKYIHTFYVTEPADMKDLPRREQRNVSKAIASAEKTRSAIGMTLCVVAVAVPLNVVFGLAAAWAASKFRWRGRTLFVSLIDLPFAVSPVVAGLIFVLLMGRMGFFGDFATHLNWPVPTSAFWRGFAESWWPIGFSDWQRGVIFTPLGIVIATTFITFPFVARALIPLMQSQGIDQEQAALTLGASGRQMFMRVTLPQIKWALLYGTILCTARAVGEFGAVSVVSGHTDPNDTMPLRIEKMWQEYNNSGAFAVASLMTLLSLATLLLKVVIERRSRAINVDISPTSRGKTT